MTRYRNVTIDGRNTFFRGAGAPDAPAIVPLNAFPSSSHMFRELIPQLAEQFHVIAPDYPGFGYSGSPLASEFRYSFDSITAPIGKLVRIRNPTSFRAEERKTNFYEFEEIDGKIVSGRALRLNDVSAAQGRPSHSLSR